MKNLGTNVVEFEIIEEIAANDLFDALLEEGLSIPVAVGRVRDSMPGLSDAFFEWLSR